MGVAAQQTMQQTMSIDAELRVPAALAQLVHFSANGPLDQVMQPRATYWLDQCLTPRPHNARACFRDRGNSRSYERLGQVFLVPPGESIRARADGGTVQTSILCHLQPESLRAWFDGELRWTDGRLQACLDIPSNHVRSLLLRLAQEMREPGFARDALTELIIAQLAIELARYCSALPARTLHGGLTAWRLQRIDARLQEERAAPTLTELAQLCNLSVRQLARSFQASRGCSIGEYIAQIRLEHAKRLLATDQSTKAVAYSLGFASPSSFCFAFRRLTQQTPRQYRLGLHRNR